MTIWKSLTAAGAILVGFMTGPTLAQAESRASMNIADHDGIYVDGGSFKVIPGTAKGDPSAVIGTSGARELGPAAIVFRKGDKLYLATVAPDQDNAGTVRRDYGGNGYRDYGGNGYRDYGGNGYRDYGGNGYRDYGGNGYRDYGGNGYRDYGGNGNRDYGGNGYRDYGGNGYRDYGGNGYRDYGGNGNRDYGGNGYRDYGGNGYRDYGGNGYRDYGGNGYRDYGGNGYRDYASDRPAGEPGPQTPYLGDPDYARYKLRRFFDENWTASGK
jgi:hypothetical protein